MQAPCWRLLTGIDVISDFRTWTWLGGQGRPLVPAFHRHFAKPGALRVVLNLGGIANISALPGHADGAPGSGSMVSIPALPIPCSMAAYRRHHPMGATTTRAAAGRLVAGLLSCSIKLLAHLLRRPHPKSSTGTGDVYPRLARPRAGRALMRTRWTCSVPLQALTCLQHRPPTACRPDATGRSLYSRRRRPQRLPAGGARRPCCPAGVFGQHRRARPRPTGWKGRLRSLAGDALYPAQTGQPACGDRRQPSGGAMPSIPPEWATLTPR